MKKLSIKSLDKLNSEYIKPTWREIYKFVVVLSVSFTSHVALADSPIEGVAGAWEYECFPQGTQSKWVASARIRLDLSTPVVAGSGVRINVEYSEPFNAHPNDHMHVFFGPSTGGGRASVINGRSIMRLRDTAEPPGNESHEYIGSCQFRGKILPGENQLNVIKCFTDIPSHQKHHHLYTLANVPTHFDCDSSNPNECKLPAESSLFYSGSVNYIYYTEGQCP